MSTFPDTRREAPRAPRDEARILRRRLINQKLARSGLSAAAEVVAWLGAVQARDLPGARWAIGLRAKRLTDAAVERAFNDGAILRTHVLRPTWHFVTPEDIRWLLALTGPRVIAGLASRHRQLELDGATIARSGSTISWALQGNLHLTRAELTEALERAGIRCTPERATHLILHAELSAIICSGPLRARRFTYALLDERVAPACSSIGREEGLARLAERYFASHGPATLADFAWWSGLSLRDARRGAEMARPALACDGARAYWSAPSDPPARAPASAARLLPNFDEYLVAYRHREAIVGRYVKDVRDALTHTVIVDGRAIGTWRRTVKPDAVSIEVVPRRRLTARERDLIGAAAKRYGAFLGVTTRLKP